MSLTSYLAAPPRDYEMITPSGVRGKLRAVIGQCKKCCLFSAAAEDDNSWALHVFSCGVFRRLG